MNIFSLKKHVEAVNILTKAGMHFWDYGNAFLLEAKNAGADVCKEGTSTEFKYPSYVQDIMGDIFSLGFGPFRWVCTSGLESDLRATDEIALEVLESIIARGVPDSVRQQYEDNCKWIREAKQHNLVCHVMMFIDNTIHVVFYQYLLILITQTITVEIISNVFALNIMNQFIMCYVNWFEWLCVCVCVCVGGWISGTHIILER
jgi:hypothetical protein